MTALDSSVLTHPFYCPVDEVIHPAADEAERLALDWVDRIGLCADDRQRGLAAATNSAEFYSRFVPHAVEENLQVAVRWVYWGFVFDDLRCDAGRFSADPHGFLGMAARVQRAVESPSYPVTDDPFVTALADIRRDLDECATPVQTQRFANAHRAWLHAVAWQVANRSRGHVPGVEEYTAMRLNAAGGAPTLALLEIANGEEVPAFEMDSPAVRALTEMAILIASWDNDLHSYYKETTQRHTEQNLVTVLAHERGVGPAGAVAGAVALRDRVMVRFLRLREDVRSRPISSACRDYLDCLGHAIRGNIDWALTVPRYTAFGDAPVRFPDPGWADEPADASPDPLRIPAITWWWEEL